VNKVIIALAREYCPIVVITHSTWDKNNKRAIGTITQTANYATTLHFEKSRDQVTVKLDSKLGSDEEEFVLNLETEEVDTTDGEQRKKDVRRLVYAPKKAPKKAKVEAAMKELGGAASAEKVALTAGVSDRYVRKVKAEQRERSAKKTKKLQKDRQDSTAVSSGTIPERNTSRVPPHVPAGSTRGDESISYPGNKELIDYFS